MKKPITKKRKRAARKFRRIPVHTHHVVMHCSFLVERSANQEVHAYGSGYSDRGALLDALRAVMDILCDNYNAQASELDRLSEGGMR